MILKLKCCFVLLTLFWQRHTRKLRASEGTAPICNMTLRAKRPSKIPPIPRNTEKWGSHLKHARLTRNLLQKEVIEILHVPLGTYRGWERNIFNPRPWHFPAIIRFLGYDPQASPSSDLCKQLKSYRRIHGLTQRELSKIFHIHVSTLRRWEKDVRPPTLKIKVLIDALNSDVQIKTEGYFRDWLVKGFPFLQEIYGDSFTSAIARWYTAVKRRLEFKQRYYSKLG